MPDTDQAADADSETISLSEYKKLQRTNNRLKAKGTKTEEQVESILSTLARIEAFQEGLATIIGADDDLRPIANQLVSENNVRRKADLTSDQLHVRLSQTLDEAEADWDDERFDSARKLYSTINETGDLSRAAELEDLVRRVIGGSEEDEIDERVRVAVEEQMSHAREGSRVDTGSTTATSGRIGKRDLAYNPRNGIEGLRENLTKAMDQIAS
jgi:hypothetical protein